MSKLDKFSVTKGQLIRLKRIEFDKEGNFKPIEVYAIVQHNYRCDWSLIANTLMDVRVEGGKLKTVKPIEVEFVDYLSKDEVIKVTMDLLLTF